VFVVQGADSFAVALGAFVFDGGYVVMVDGAASFYCHGFPGAFLGFRFFAAFSASRAALSSACETFISLRIVRSNVSY
jgi:hypothetical protein